MLDLLVYDLVTCRILECVTSPTSTQRQRQSNSCTMKIWLQTDRRTTFIFQWLAFILFFAATFAESNRLPFDLAEGEAELVAGFHVEYGGFKMLMFFIGEYAHMMIAAGLCTTFFFGGYLIPFWSVSEVQAFMLDIFSSPTIAGVMVSLIFFISYLMKFLFFLWVFVWVRWTLPRFRYDQLMDLGWKTMLPWALGNTIVTSVVIFCAAYFKF